MAKYSKRKKVQRKANSIIKSLNKSLCEDVLWLGRFEMKQTNVVWNEFDDHSGGILNVKIRCIDKKTGYHKDFWIDFLDNVLCSTSYQFWYYINEFITKWSNAWQMEPRPSIDNAIDYRNTKVDSSIWSRADNFFLTAFDFLNR